jgi:multimeric flavodoxin WrbA
MVVERKAVGIAGSPRGNGNSSTMMRVVLDSLAEIGVATRETRLNQILYRGCQGCVKCSATGKCVLNDELTPVLEDLRSADIWVLSSPIYYDGVTGQFKTFFDRLRTFTKDPETQALSPRLEGRRAAAILLSYADTDREEYFKEAEKLAFYLKWMGDFNPVEILVEGGLATKDDALKRSGLRERLRNIGHALAN